MADYPGFIAIETGEDDGLPLAIAWSLPDGRIKQTLIQPDDSWISEDTNVMGSYSIEELESLGVSPLDVIRELRPITSRLRCTPAITVRMKPRWLDSLTPMAWILLLN